MKKTLLLLLLACLLLALPAPADAQTGGQPVVRGLLFYKTTCPFCHQVINEFLLPLQETRGQDFDIRGVNVDTTVGKELFSAYFDKYNPSSGGVPALLVGETVLIGAEQIPGVFPTLLDQGLAQGGVDWPDLPGLAEYIRAEDPQGASGNAIVPLDTALSGGQPQGTELARIVFAVLIGAVALAVWRSAPTWEVLSDPQRPSTRLTGAWLVPALAVVGLAISGYLTYVKLTSTAEAVCGPVGNCSAVQDHPTSIFLGVPVALWGVIGYVLILIFWSMQQYGQGSLANWSQAGLAAVALGGTAFSMYLTYLEIVVIRAICLWCLGSAVTIALLLIVVSLKLPDLAVETRKIRRTRSKRRR